MTADTARLRAHKDPQLPAPPACDDETAWWASLQCFDAARAQTLLAAARTLYPHDTIGEPVYRRVVSVLDGVCAALPSRRDEVDGLLRRLDAHHGLAFVGLSESYRVSALGAQAHTPVFRFLQRFVVRHLYDDREVWEAFGYEGASHHLGGFLHRGFDDLDWLPAGEARA